LLHDVGKAVLLAELPDEYRPILSRPDFTPQSLVELETERFGCSHAQVGAYLLSIWGLPAPLVHAVALHHRPDDDAQTVFSSLTAVHCADVIIAESDTAPLNRDCELNAAYLERLGLSEKMAAWRGLLVDPAGEVTTGRVA